jgi:hypothetical protein
LPRSVFEIDVKDEKFRNFLNLFKDYQDQLGKMSGFWNEAGTAASGAETSVSSMTEVLAASAASTALISDAMERTSSSASRASNTFSTMAGRAKDIAGWIEHATIRLAKWGVLSLGAGLIGGGVGLFGLDRLGEGVAGTRRVAQGLGISSGELSAFQVNFGQRLGLGADFLNTVQGAQADLSERWKFSALGIPAGEVGSADTARLTTDVIQRAHDLWQQAGPAGHNTQWMQAHGLEGIMSFNQWQQIGAQSQGDLNKWSQQYQHDARGMSVTDPMQKQWVEFTTQLERAGKQIEIALVDGLEPLVKSDALQKLSASIVVLVEKFFANNNVIAGIDHLSEGISKLGDYLGSEKFQNDLKSFVDDVAYAAQRMVEVLRFLHLIPQASTAGQQFGPGSPEATANMPGIGRNLKGWSSWPNLFKSPFDFGPLGQATGVPAGMLQGLAEQESGVRAHPEDAIDSHGVRHQGMFQMSPDMQKEWGVDDPYNPDQEAKGTARAEASYLKQFHGNIAQAIAAWFEGPTGVQRRIDQANERHIDWWQAETPQVRAYVESVAAKMHVDVKVLNQTGANVAVTANATRQ